METTTTPEEKIADALRAVALKLTKAIDEKYINRSSVDADTLAETLLAVADDIDPQ